MFDTIKQMPRNIWLLALTLALVQGAMPLMVLVSGLIGSRIAPSKDLATLPVALAVVGVALFTVPAVLLCRKLGRKRASYIGLCCGLLGVLLSAYATQRENFAALLIASVFIGVSTAFYQQLRFAAIESLDDIANTGPALSILMLSGIVAGILGPELVTLAAWLHANSESFAGAFYLMAVFIILGMLVFSLFKNPQFSDQEESGEARPLKDILRQPLFLVAVSASLVSFAVMVFLMTSTPISMHIMHGHSLADAKWVIQSHVVAMFLPSVFSGFLLKRIGPAPLMVTGSVFYVLVIVIGFSGAEVVHYWWALVLLGVGWNFLFLSGTSLLPQVYRASERYKVQAANDFLVFTAQALASLSAGWVLFNFGWNTQLWLCLPVAVFSLLVSLYYFARKHSLAA